MFLDPESVNNNNNTNKGVCFLAEKQRCLLPVRDYAGLRTAPLKVVGSSRRHVQPSVGRDLRLRCVPDESDGFSPAGSTRMFAWSLPTHGLISSLLAG